MNTNTNEPNQLLPIAAPPEGITRRSFIKRTASTALVVALAIGAFENEARAEDCSSSTASEWTLEMTGYPESEVDPDAEPENAELQLPIRLKSVEQLATPVFLNRDYVIVVNGVSKHYNVKNEIKMKFDPHNFTRTVGDDGKWHYHYSGEGVDVEARVQLLNKTTGAVEFTYPPLNQNPLTVHASFSATIDKDKGKVTGVATPSDTQHATVAMPDNGFFQMDVIIMKEDAFSTPHEQDGIEVPGKITFKTDVDVTVHQWPAGQQLPQGGWTEPLHLPTNMQSWFIYSGYKHAVSKK